MITHLKEYILQFCRYYSWAGRHNPDFHLSDDEESEALKALDMAVSLGLWETSYFIANGLQQRFGGNKYYICKTEIRHLLK